MKFEINDLTWIVEEVEEKRIIDELQKQEPNTITAGFGLCDYRTHKIWINKDMSQDQKLQTLTHELTHCYLWSNGIRLEEYPEEMICDMMYALTLFLNEATNGWKEYIKRAEKCKSGS